MRASPAAARTGTAFWESAHSVEGQAGAVLAAGTVCTEAEGGAAQAGSGHCRPECGQLGGAPCRWEMGREWGEGGLMMCSFRGGFGESKFLERGFWLLWVGGWGGVMAWTPAGAWRGGEFTDGERAPSRTAVLPPSPQLPASELQGRPHQAWRMWCMRVDVAPTAGPPFLCQWPSNSEVRGASVGCTGQPVNTAPEEETEGPGSCLQGAAEAGLGTDRCPSLRPQPPAHRGQQALRPRLAPQAWSFRASWSGRCRLYPAGEADPSGAQGLTSVMGPFLVWRLPGP